VGWSACRSSDLSRVLTGVGHGFLIETAIQRTPSNSQLHIGAQNSAQAAMTSRSLWGGGARWSSGAMALLRRSSRISPGLSGGTLRRSESSSRRPCRNSLHSYSTTRNDPDRRYVASYSTRNRPAPASDDPGSDEAVAIDGTTIVVGIVIPTIALRDSVDQWCGR